MCDFKIWLKTKLNDSDSTYWQNRFVQVFTESEVAALITILDDWAEGLIYLTPSEKIVLQANLDEFKRNVVQ